MRMLVLSSIFILLIVLFPYVYKSGKIICKTQYGECSQDINLKVQSVNGQPIKQVTKLISERLKDEAKIESFKTVYHPLNTFQVDIIQKKAEVAIKEIDTLEYLLFSSDGNIVEKSTSTVLPKVILEDSSYKSDSPESRFASKLLIELYKYYSIDTITMIDGSLVGWFDAKLKLTFPLEGDIDVLLGSLELLLFQLNQSLQNSKIEDVRNFKVTSIDLRYKNPVIK